MRECQVKIWGEQLEGVKCSSNSDCYSNVCNKTLGLCGQGIEETLSCLADNVTPVVGRFLFNEWGILANVTKALLVAQLRTRFVIADQCTGPTSIKFRDNYWWSRDEATCTDGCLTGGLETHCLDTLCPILPICDYQQLGLCYRNWVSTPITCILETRLILSISTSLKAMSPTVWPTKSAIGCPAMV